LCLVALVETHRDQGRFGDDDWVDGWLLDLTGQKQCYRAVVVLIIGIMMDEFMQAWTDYQDRSPLEHRRQNQRDGECAGIPSGAGLLGFSLSVHEAP